MRAMMTAILTMRGHDVVEAQTARAAIQTHRDQPADVIITDLVMKEMDGIELLRRIRAFSPDTPIIAISGDEHGKIYLNMAKLVGAERMLAKPFLADQLLRAVDEVLGVPPVSGERGSASGEA